MRHSPEVHSNALVRQPAADNASDINNEMVNVDVLESRECMRNPVVRLNSAFHDDWWTGQSFSVKLCGESCQHDRFRSNIANEKSSILTSGESDGVVRIREPFPRYELLKGHLPANGGRSRRPLHGVLARPQ